MSAATVLPGRLVEPRLPDDDQREEIADTGPKSQAPHQAHHQSKVQAGTVVVEVVSPASATSRVHEVTVLSLIAVTQLGWLALLGYGLF